jgi:hypothetical protein
MNGLELSRAYYAQHGRPMLEAEFSDLLPLLAVGLFGSGSECLGFDDAVSEDHDFEPGFCILLPEEALVDRRQAFLLERAYAKLPREFMGYTRSLMNPVGGARRGVMRTADFFTRTVGTPNGVLDLRAWLTIPEQALLEATNGEVYHDPFGEVTRIRKTLSAFPEDVRRKRLAGQLLLMAQAGQYNVARCKQHGEPEAAQLACVEFVKSAVSAVFLLNRRYQPYYKWSFRALRGLPELSELAAPLSKLLTAPAADTIETVSAAVIAALQAQNLTVASGADLERHAYAVNDTIRDSELRNLHILAGV